MLCNSCKRKPICKHYDYLVNAVDLEVKVESCMHLELNLEPMTTAHFDFPKTKINNTPSVDPGVALLNSVERDITMNYRDLSNKINNDNSSDAFKVTATPTELSVCDNPECGAKTYEEDKTVCSCCGKAVCPVCSYADMHQLNNMPVEDNIDSTGVLKIICEDCHKAQDVVPKETKKRGRPRKSKEKEVKAMPFGIDVLEENAGGNE